MLYNVHDILELDDNNSYIVMDIIDYDNNKYAFLSDINNHRNFMYVQIKSDGSLLSVDLKQKKLISELNKHLSQIVSKELSDLSED